MIKKIIIWGTVLVAVLVIAALAVVYLKLDSFVKKGVETVGPQLTHSEVKLDGVHLSPFSGEGHLSGLLIGNPEGYKTAFAIKVGKLDLAVDIASVKGDVITIKSIHISGPEVTYEGGLRGANNINKLLENVQAATGGTSTATPAPAGSSPGATASSKKYVVQDIVIEGTKLHASITELGGKEMTIPLPPLHLTNIGNAGQGLAIGDVVQQIIKPLLESITESIGKEAVNFGKDALGNVLKGGTNATQTLDKASSTLKGLFK